MAMTPRPLPMARGFGAQDEQVDNRGKRIGVLVVAYNAVGTLVQVLKRIPAAVWENVEEVAVFDDASGDATYERAVGYKAVADAHKVQIVKHEKNLGYGGNQKAGYAYFMAKGFDVVVLLHGDGQYAPEILHHLYHPIVAGSADAVLGSRMMPDFEGPLKGGMPLYKYVGNRVLSTFENQALGMNLTEFHSGYRAYSLQALRQIAMEAMTDDFHFDTEIIVKLHHQGFRIKEVPIPTYYGNEICYVNGMKYAFDIVRAVRRYKSTIRSARRYPEFAEYFITYPLKEGRYSSHGIVRQVVGRNQDVLDVGCGDGYFASAIGQEANVVCGIDLIPAPRRREAFSEYVSADLNEGLSAAARRLERKTFDKVLMMDVLQQLPEPEKVLRDSLALLKPNGRLIVSLPNVANLTVRLQMLLGRFGYSDRGILDRRHLRFFTRRSARALLQQSGFRVVTERATVMPLEFVLDLPRASALMRALYRVLAFFTALLPGMLGYQWVFVAQPNVET
ncbi:MAG: methyltransferase domain-containing protein [Candidatus Eremiobacteraeota bacterium]|nr:methyltransferase domain-containing protein [Candidatus Eremiobacteraeota bacterium]